MSNMHCDVSMAGLLTSSSEWMSRCGWISIYSYHLPSSHCWLLTTASQGCGHGYVHLEAVTFCKLPRIQTGLTLETG